MDRDLDWRKLDRYLAGQSSAEETVEVQRWIAAAPDRAEVVAALRDVDRDSECDVDVSWQRLRSRMHELDTAGATVPLRDARWGWRARTAGRRTLGRFGHSAMLRAAAVALAVFGGATLWLYRLDTPRAAYAAAEIVTRPGMRQVATLPDGSEVVIAPASRVRYRRQGVDSERVVELEGNAYFRVAADPEHPFVVRAGGAETRVLGTEFDVRAFPADDGVRVIVAEGRVSLRASARAGAAVVLEPGDLGQVRADGGIDVSRDIDLARYLAWTTGGIVFDDVSLAQALPELERTLGLELRLADPSLAARRLTIDLRTDSPDAVIEAISLVLDLSAEQTGDAVTLHPNP